MHNRLFILYFLISFNGFADVTENWFAGLNKLKMAKIHSFKRSLKDDPKQMDLKYVFLKSVNKRRERAIVVSPGFAENHLKYAGLTEQFLSQGFDVFIINHRGMGFSDRYLRKEGMSQELHRQIVHVDSFGEYILDFEYFVKTIIRKRHHYKGDLYNFSHSTGGLISAFVISRNKDLFKKAVLSAPLFGINYSTIKWMIVNLGQAIGLSKNWGPVTTNVLWDARTADFDPSVSDTSDENQWQLYIDVLKQYPDLVQSPASRGWIQEVEKYSANSILKKLAQNIRTPTYIFSAGKDHFVNSKRHNLFLKYSKEHNEEMRKKNQSKKLSPIFLHSFKFENSNHCIFRDTAAQLQLDLVFTIFNR